MIEYPVLDILGSIREFNYTFLTYKLTKKKPIVLQFKLKCAEINSNYGERLQMKNHYDVIIIGAGLSVGSELSKALNILLIDKKPTVQEVARSWLIPKIEEGILKEIHQLFNIFHQNQQPKLAFADGIALD